MLIRSFLALASVLPLASPVAAQRDFDAVQITTEDVGGGVYVLFGEGGNIGLSVGEDGALLVDDQFAPLTGKILAAVAEITDHPVRFVLNTHWHSDHTGGNENLAKEGSLIVAHEKARRRMNPADFPDIGKSEQFPPEALPVVTFDQGVSFHWNGLEIEAVYVPTAHTDGDVIIFFRGANVVHMGDLFLHGGLLPFIDVDSGGGMDGLISAAEIAIAETDDETRVIPGHGPVTDRAMLIVYLEALEAARERIAARVAAGESEDEAAADHVELLTGLGAELGWSPHATGFVSAERFIRLAYRSLAAN